MRSKLDGQNGLTLSTNSIMSLHSLWIEPVTSWRRWNCRRKSPTSNVTNAAHTWLSSMVDSARFLACPNYPECKNTKPLLKRSVCLALSAKTVKLWSAELKRAGCFMDAQTIRHASLPLVQTCQEKCPHCGVNLVMKARQSSRYAATRSVREKSVNNWPCQNRRV